MAGERLKQMKYSYQNVLMTGGIDSQKNPRTSVSFTNWDANIVGFFAISARAIFIEAYQLF